MVVEAVEKSLVGMSVEEVVRLELSGAEISYEEMEKWARELVSKITAADNVVSIQ